MESYEGLCASETNSEVGSEWPESKAACFPQTAFHHCCIKSHLTNLVNAAGSWGEKSFVFLERSHCEDRQ